MVTVVVIINMLMSLMLFYVAWRVWQLKRRLVKIADTLTAAERSTHAVLHRAPNAIYKSQQNVQSGFAIFKSSGQNLRKVEYWTNHSPLLSTSMNKLC